VDERLLYDTFSAFGIMATTAKVRDQYSSFHVHVYSFVLLRLLETLAQAHPKAMASLLTLTLKPQMLLLNL